MKKSTIATLLASLAPLCGFAGIEVNQVGDTNTMVRITEPKQYLIMPVQEAMPDAKVDILVNGDIKGTIYVRLADSKIDYTVPLDLSPYTAQGEVLLNIISEGNRSHSRNVADYICWSEMDMADAYDSSNREKYRPAYHHTPRYGWMNDPNGMYYNDGVWHLYYQHNPYGSKWQNMTWGHSTSTDLVNWEPRPLAIMPNGLGSIFSGSCVVVGDSIAAFYTSAGHSQVQSLAWSTDDGNTFTSYPGNPVIANEREARDPNLFWHQPSQQWVLVLAEALDHTIGIYTSPDLIDWTHRSSFGKDYGCQDGVWECPDLFELPIDGEDASRWVMIVNINPGGPHGGSATQYFVGDFDGSTFTADTPAEVTKWMDYGKDHYATVSWYNAPDNRRTVIGWMSNWQYANDVPTMQFRSANTLPRDLSLWRAPDGELYLASVPSPELDGMRLAPSITGAKNLGNDTVKYLLSADNDGICEIDIDYNAKNCKALEFTLSNHIGERVVMILDPTKREFAMDRRESGITDFSHDFPAVTVAPTLSAASNGSLRIYIDRSSIEAFDGQGRFAMTNLVFPTQPYTTLSVTAIGGRAKINSVNIYPLSIQ